MRGATNFASITRVTFYRRWLTVAVGHSFGPADALAGGLGMAIPAIITVYPGLSGTLVDLTWQLPLGSFVALLMGRAVLAPFWIYRDLEEQCSANNRASVDFGKKLDRLASKELVELYDRCSELHWQLSMMPRKKSDAENLKPLTSDTRRAAQTWSSDFDKFMVAEYGETKARVISESLDDYSLWSSPSEKQLQQYIEHALSAVRALIHEAA